MSPAARAFRIASESIKGRREGNEDAVLAELLPDGRLLLAVADGMGGHAAGEVASALALETLRDALLSGRSLEEGFLLANQEVHGRSSEPGRLGMGTTLVAALFDPSGVLVANVGDSRGYLLTGSGIRQITQDHSFLAEAIRRGQPAEEALGPRWRDALTRSVGSHATVEVDLFGPSPAGRDAALLLCSDGLYKTLEDGDIAGTYRRAAGAREAVRELVARAYERGSDDNISVVVAEWGKGPRAWTQGTLALEEGPAPEIIRRGTPPADPVRSPPPPAPAPLAVPAPPSATRRAQAPTTPPSAPPPTPVVGGGSKPARRGRPLGTLLAILALAAALVAYMALRP